MELVRFPGYRLASQQGCNIFEATIQTLKNQAMEKKKNLLASTIVTGTLAMFSSTGSAQVTPDAGAQGDGI